MGDRVLPPARIKTRNALLGPASSPPHLAVTHDRSVLELSRSPPLSERPGGKGRAGRREPARGSPLSLSARGGGERVGSEDACATRRRGRAGAEGGPGRRAGTFAPDQWQQRSAPSVPLGTLGRPKEAPEGGGVREEKTEVGRGQNGCEGCCAPPPPGPRSFSRSPAVSRLRASSTPGFRA